MVILLHCSSTISSYSVVQQFFCWFIDKLCLEIFLFVDQKTYASFVRKSTISLRFRRQCKFYLTIYLFLSSFFLKGETVFHCVEPDVKDSVDG